MSDLAKKRLRVGISLADVVVFIPTALLLGVFFGDRNYVVTSLVIVVLALIPFFLLFENKKLKARELVPIAIMTAIAVAGRMAFYFLPQFKPVVAIIIITGVAFGCEAGFLSGALAMLCSNFLFGQGPWTPWQMFACGFIGYVSGLFGRHTFTKKTVFLCIWGFFACFIYGFFVDAWALLGFSYEITWQAIVTVYSAGFAFNLILAAATVVFLGVLSYPLLCKLDRVKIKYGLIASSAPPPPKIETLPEREITGFGPCETSHQTAENADTKCSENTVKPNRSETYSEADAKCADESISSRN